MGGRVTPRQALPIIAGITAGVIVWQLYRKASGAVSGALDDLAALPGRALDAVADAARAVVDGTSPVSDPAGGGFVKQAAPARVVNYSGLRDIDPLIAFFIAQGNTATSRAAAYRAGWTADEVSLAVLAMAQHFGNV